MESKETTEFLTEKKALDYLASLGVPMSRMTLISIRKTGSLTFSRVRGRIFYRADSLRSLIISNQNSGGNDLCTTTKGRAAVLA